MVNNDSKIKVCQPVVIFGVGGLGFNIAKTESMVSANPVVGVYLHREKLNMGKRFGLPHGLIRKNDNLESTIKYIAGITGTAVVIETTVNSNGKSRLMN